MALPKNRILGRTTTIHLLMALVLLLGCHQGYVADAAFLGIRPEAVSLVPKTTNVPNHHRRRRRHATAAAIASRLRMGLGDFTVELQKPLGIVLQERNHDDTSREGGRGGGGARVRELVEGGAAAIRTDIVPGDVLLHVNENDVSTLDFDSIMDLLTSLDTAVSPARLAWGDGLGMLDMPKNVVKQLKSTEDAFYVDAVVRRAVREIRRRGGNRLGDLLRVEVIIGAGVRKGNFDGEDGRKGQVRFFAIFSTGGGSSYSCNVQATGVQREEDGHIEIVSLSAAKDEGLGQTVEFI